MTPQERKNFESIRDNVHGEPMTQVEVMKLAREVIQDYIDEYGPHEKDSGAAYTLMKLDQAIEQAQKISKLEEKTADHDVDCLCVSCNELDYLEDLEQAQKQIPPSAYSNTHQQEPVAHMYPCDLEEFKSREMCAYAYSIEYVSASKGETIPLYTSPPQRQPKQEPVGRFSKFTDGVWKEVTATSAGQPLYAAPPQRQPLTRDDLWKLWCNAKAENEYMFWLVFARAIEAAHGIKGGA